MPVLADLPIQQFIQDELISIALTSSAGKALTDCAADLPAGWSIAISATADGCEISGEASDLLSLTEITVTATNSGGSDSGLVPVEVVAASPFITTWQTNNEGTSEDNQIFLPVSPDFDYDFNVDWGDGSSDINVTDSITHTYAQPGTYQVSITGRYPQPACNINGDEFKLISVDAWGNRPWLSMSYSFAFCSSLVSVDSQAPNLSRVTDLEGMFLFASHFNSPIGNWDTSAITNMRRMFYGAESFDQDISTWDVSQVQTMAEMFKEAFVFNQPIGGWDVSKVTEMNSLFESAALFNQDITSWDVSGVTTMAEMFNGAEAFNQDIRNWDVSNVESMGSMFREASAFNQNIAAWQTGKVTDLYSMFRDAVAFNQDISDWDTSQVTTMDSMFRQALNFDQDLSQWNISAVTNMASFAESSGLSFNNYNAMLQAWAQLPLQSDVFFGVGSLQYGFEAEAARTTIIDTFGWSIEDGGLATLPALQDTATTFYTANGVKFLLTNLGGSPGSCAADNLPAGLSIGLSENGSSCVITGAAQAIQAETVVSVSATNVVGTQSANLTLTVLEETPFVTIWKTDNPGASDDNQITIQTNASFAYDYTVEWGDGSVDTNLTGDRTHTYASAGAYTVSISGNFPAITFTPSNSANASDSLKLLSVEQWGLRTWLSMENAFFNCDNLVINDTASPDLSQATVMTNVFAQASNFNSDISGWDVSNITRLDGAFVSAKAFNQDIGAWNVSKVTTMRSMFNSASVFNQNIGSWDVSQVTDMAFMFDAAKSFNQDIGNWNVDRVLSMRSMFEQAQVFDQDISAWNTGKVTSMSRMFREARAFNQEIGPWDVSSVTNMSDMFFASSAFNADLSTWDVTSATNLSRMFRGANNFDQNLADWDISSASNMSDTFSVTPLSTSNYDAILIAWSQNPNIKNGVKLGATSTHYSSAAQSARDFLINEKGWEINDAGLFIAP
nr:BspA family leucine-rich repeat surface protein [Teredinibacter turnerae]